MVVLSKADALLVNGAGMESFLPAITSAYPDLPVIDATADLPFLSESDVIEIGEAEEGEEVNSHLWMDPQRAAGMAANLAEGLIRLLPDREQQITENLKDFRDRLLALDETLQAELQHSSRKVIIFHEAFPYFVEACGVPVAAIVNKEPDDDLSAAGLSRIMALMAEEDPMPVIVKSQETDLPLCAGSPDLRSGRSAPGLLRNRHAPERQYPVRRFESIILSAVAGRHSVIMNYEF